MSGSLQPLGGGKVSASGSIDESSDTVRRQSVISSAELIKKLERPWSRQNSRLVVTDTLSELILLS